MTADDTDVGGYDLFAYDAVTGAKTLLSGPVEGGYDQMQYQDFVWDSSNSNWDIDWSSDGQSFQLVTSSSLTTDDTDSGGMDIYSINVTTEEKTLIDLGLDFVDGQGGWGETVDEASGVLLGTWNVSGGPNDYFWSTY
jgi:hypothetical protein